MKKQIIGYKASYNQKCRGHLFKVRKTYELQNTPPVCCQQGFHFCQNASDVILYYEYGPSFVLFEVIAKGDIDTFYDKSCTNKIYIKRIIPRTEYKNVFKDNDEFEFVFHKKGHITCIKNKQKNVEYYYDVNGFMYRQASSTNKFEVKYYTRGKCKGRVKYWRENDSTERFYNTNGRLICLISPVTNTIERYRYNKKGEKIWFSKNGVKYTYDKKQGGYVLTGQQHRLSSVIVI
jgi:hypothetical protein